MGRITCDVPNSPKQLDSLTHCNICLSSGEAIGLAFSAQTGSISFLSVIVLFIIIWVKYRRNRSQNPTSRRILFRSHLDVFMLNLFISELLMSLGGMLDAKWANESQVYCGGFCNAQGSLQYLGETSVAIWTLAVTIHTWWTVVYARRIQFRPWMCAGVVVAVWVFVFAFNFGEFARHPKGDNNIDNYFAPTPYWCWINSNYYNERLAGQYIWLWIAGFGNLLVYIPLFLLLRGNIVLGTDGLKSHGWHWTPLPAQNAFVHRVDSQIEDGHDEETVRKDATKMLWYPIAYTILVLPLSIVRWTTFTHHDMSAIQRPENRAIATATLVFHAVFRLSGVVNVGLVLGTRPNVLLFGEHRRGEDEDDDDTGTGRSLDRYGEPDGGSNVSLRHRQNAPGTNMVSTGTGFGGPTVNLGRREDDEKIPERS